MAKQKQIQTESITKLSISAIDKAAQVLASIPKVLVDFNSIKEEVEKVKSDLNLGLAKYEVEIQEKKDKLDNEYKELIDSLEKVAENKREQLRLAQIQVDRQIEEIKYSHKQAIEREDLNTASTIANKNGLVLLPSNTTEEHMAESTLLEKKHKSDMEAAIKASVKNAEEKLNGLVKDKETQIVIITNDLANAKEKVSSLIEEINYLKEQLNASRKQTVDALAAAKVSVTQSNQGK